MGPSILGHFPLKFMINEIVSNALPNALFVRNYDDDDDNVDYAIWKSVNRDENLFLSQIAKNLDRRAIEKPSNGMYFRVVVPQTF